MMFYINTALNCPLGSLPGEGRHSLIWPKGVCAAEHGMGTAKKLIQKVLK